MRLYVDGVWTGRPDRVITIDNVEYDLDDYAKAHGIDLPDSKPKKSKKEHKDIEVNIDGDMEQTYDSGYTEEYGGGTSQSTE